MSIHPKNIKKIIESKGFELLKKYFEELDYQFTKSELTQLAIQKFACDYISEIGDSEFDLALEECKLFAKNKVRKDLETLYEAEREADRLLFLQKEQLTIAKFEQDFNSGNSIAEGLQKAFNNLPNNFLK